MNNINTWQQGIFINSPCYKHWSTKDKQIADHSEKLLVRPSADRNAICQCFLPADAIWIANRLNLASDLEQMVYDFATGKTDGKEIIDYVKSKLETL